MKNSVALQLQTVRKRIEYGVSFVERFKAYLPRGSEGPEAARAPLTGLNSRKQPCVH